MVYNVLSCVQLPYWNIRYTIDVHTRNIKKASLRDTSFTLCLNDGVAFACFISNVHNSHVHGWTDIPAMHT